MKTATLKSAPTPLTEMNVRRWRVHEFKRRVQGMLPRSTGYHNRIRISPAKLAELRSLLEKA